MKKVIDEYLATGSINASSVACGMSAWKARKILITKGLYTSERIDEANNLREQGKTIVEIAQVLQIRPKSVVGLIPYSRLPYTGNSRVTIWRRKKQQEQ